MSPAGITLVERFPGVDDYRRLRLATGLSDKSEAVAQAGQLVHQRGDDILLFGEMIGEVAHADGKRVGNRAHGDVAVALFVEKPQGDGQNFFTGG